jgi:CubicO group peptidase (beta-lactamase class C family)
VGRRLSLPLALIALLGAAPLAAQYDRVDAIVQDGVTRGVYPGAAVVIGTSTRILHAEGYGHFTWSATSAVPSADSTLWDVASLTKVVATTGAVALLVDRGQLLLDAPVSRYLPRFTGSGREKVTVRMLLEHTSGLPAGLDPAARPRGRDSVLALVYRTPLRRAPGAAEQYSDLNAILLGLIVERVGGRPLDQFAASELFAPLGMTSTRFLPPREWRRRIAPTAQWHGTPLAGEVNDATSGRMGGVAGHAGVFASATDLARYAQWWLRRGSGGATIRAATIDTFLAPTGGPRLLGWESRAANEYTPSPYGALLTDRAYGHTGYTGTMIWIDPARDLFVIFLTNRVYGPRVAKPFQALHEVRAKLADAAVRAAPAGCRAEIRPAC